MTHKNGKPTLRYPNFIELTIVPGEQCTGIDNWAGVLKNGVSSQPYEL
ncbi:MAG: hypothetical protein I8H72_00040 [Myxococcaceae bacterium]|nr:hypothetical protein [Myxococcaceae bacterium]